MTSEFQETRNYMHELAMVGTSFNNLTKSERTKLISIYTAELDAIDSLFEDQQPSRFIVSNFLEKPNSDECRTRIIDELTDCIFVAHEHHIEDLFEIVENEIAKENGEISEREEFLRADNRERYRDMTWHY